MKSVLLAGALAAGALVGVASGRPLNAKRAVVTEVVYVTETAAQVVVYVDQDGVAYSTSFPATTSSTVVVESSASPTVEPSSAPKATPSSASPAPEAPAPSPMPTSSAVATPDARPAVETPKPEPTTVKPIAAEPVSVEPTSVEIPVEPSIKPPAPTSLELAEKQVSSVVVKPSSVPPPPPPAPTTQEPEPEKPSSPPPAPTAQAPEPKASAPADPPAPPSVPAPVPAPASAPSPAAAPVQAEYEGGLPIGITYDPFAGSQDNSRCKTEQEVADEFAKMKDYKVVRIYGMGCNIVPLAVQNAAKNGQQLMVGAYLSNKGNGEDLNQVIKTAKSAIDQYAGGNWGLIKLFSVENERVNDHDMAASEVVDAINRARGQLRGLGYNGPVGAVDTVPATVDNPSICKASDVVMVNCHAFFDPNTEASNAGKFVKSQLDQVKKACGTDRVVVTETGWPHEGSSNGKAIPSIKNQKAALASIRSEFDRDVFLFNAFDSPWKSDWASSFNAERWWGILQ